MKSIKFIVVFLTLGVFANFQVKAQITGQGSSVTEKIDLPVITSIGLGIAADVYLTQGSKQEITIKAQKNIIENIKKEVKNGSWNIEFDKKVTDHNDIKIYITLATIKDLSVGGSGSIVSESKFTNLGDLNLSIGGSGDIKLHADARDISCSIGGSGEIELQGTGDELSVSIGGSGDVDAFDLPVKKCSVSASGSGDINVNVSNELSVSLVGSGDVNYKGNPKVSSSIIGSGDVEKVN